MRVHLFAYAERLAVNLCARRRRSRIRFEAEDGGVEGKKKEEAQCYYPSPWRLSFCSLCPWAAAAVVAACFRTPIAAYSKHSYAAIAAAAPAGPHLLPWKYIPDGVWKYLIAVEEQRGGREGRSMPASACVAGCARLLIGVSTTIVKQDNCTSNANAARGLQRTKQQRA